MRFKLLDLLLVRWLNIEDISYILCKKMAQSGTRSIEISHDATNCVVKGKISVYGRRKGS